jgi:hypothetical protein
MKLNLGGYATTEVDGFKSIERTEDGKIIAVFDSSAVSSGTVSLVIHDGTKPVTNGPILIEAQDYSVKE